MRFPIITKVAGATFGDAQKNIKRFGCLDIGSYAMVREPDNPHDLNAISIRIGDFHLGYVPKDIARFLAHMMDAGRSFIALFVSKNVSPVHDTLGLTIKIVETTPQRKSEDFAMPASNQSMMKGGVQHEEPF